MKSEFEALEDLAGIAFDAELFRLSALSKKLSVRSAALAALRADRVRRNAMLADGRARDDIAFLAGQDARWSEWVHRESQRLSLELAEIAAQREAQRKQARAAFGKQDVLRQLHRAQVAEAKLRAARRFEQG